MCNSENMWNVFRWAIICENPLTLPMIIRLSNTGLSAVVLDMDYTDSLPLSFFLSCGNIMAHDQQEPANQVYVPRDILLDRPAFQAYIFLHSLAPSLCR